MEEGKTVEIVGEKNKRRRKEKVVFPTGGGEAKTPENVETLYAYVRSWGTEEEDDITFPDLN